MDHKEIGERLKGERERLNYSQSKFAELGGVGKTTQISYEKGDSYPDASFLAAVAGAGVDVLYIVTGQRTPRLVEGLNEREKAIVENYRSLSEGDQAALQRLSDALAQSIDKKVAK